LDKAFHRKRAKGETNVDFINVPVEYESPLVNSYLRNYPEVSHLFEHNPFEPDSYAGRYEIIMRDYHTDREELVRLLTDYNKGLGCAQKALENLAKLTDPGTVAVVTGQQAGVFTGPLYTIYKAITAIQLAAELTHSTGKQVIPLFWVAAEDHDYAEVDHIDLLDREHETIRLKLAYDPPGKISIGTIPVNNAVFQLIGELDRHTNSSEWKSDIIRKLEELAGKYDNLADWFAAVMSWLFREYGLALVNPMNSGLRSLWSGTFQAFLQETDRVNEKLQTGMERVRALGVEPQVEKEENNVHMFLYTDGERLPLFKTGDRYTVRGRDRAWTAEELRETARNNPGLLSPNVVLRPVAQDVLIPIMAYVAGPGEISYYALYRDIYPLFGQRMPIIYPRANITLVERTTARHMERYGISFAGGLEGLRQKLTDYLDSQDEIGIECLFGTFTERVEQLYQELVEKVTEIDPELARYGNESLNKILHQVEYFRKKACQYHRRSCDTAIKRFRVMENQLFPKNNWQERVFNIFPYLFK